MTTEQASWRASLAERVHAPLHLPELEAHPCMRWTRLTPNHIGLLTALVARIEAADNPPYRTSGEEIAEMLGPASSWRGLAGVATTGAAAGELVCYGHVAIRHAVTVECVCEGGVDPRFRRIGLGRSMVEWETGAARQMLATTPGSGPAQIVWHVNSDQDVLEQHLESLGYHWARSYYELRADLGTVRKPPQLGPFLQVVGWSPELEDPVRRANNVLSEQEWGRPPRTMEQWLMGRSCFVPGWSFVALDQRSDRPRVAGFLLASKYEQDWAALGWKEGYLDLMGVLPQWRNTHVAEALILASMGAQRADGMDRTGAGIGSANHSGALAVYASLGFRAVGQSRLYAIDV